MSKSHPPDPAFVKLGDTFTIPEGHAGDEDRDPAEWAKKLWEVPWKVAQKGKMAKRDLLPKFLAMKPVRELMARVGFFWSGKRQEERLSDRIANVESAFIYCLGEVQDPECLHCSQRLGPWVCFSVDVSL